MYKKRVHDIPRLNFMNSLYDILSFYFSGSVLYSSFLFGFMGNQPFRTLSLCSKSSFMVQNDEKENTPKRVEINILSVITEPAIPMMPSRRKIHQHLVPQQYSAFTTMGWKKPIMRKVHKPMIMPPVFSSAINSIINPDE